MRRPVGTCLLVILVASTAFAHDIPNARVDRSIQASLEPGKLRVDYEVSLAELTLAQDLRQLVGDLPGADRRAWFEAYGKEVGPLNAKGLLIQVDGSEVELRTAGFELAIEGHPRYTFHFEADVPPSGRLTMTDTNYVASEGTSRLALRAVGRISIRGDSLPAEVTQIPIRPVWQLSSEEERRTRWLTIDYAPQELPVAISTAEPRTAPADTTLGSISLSNLLDDQAGRAFPALMLAAVILGAAHAIQPGHGKTLVAAASIGPGGTPVRGALIALTTAAAHLSSVALIALAIGMTRFSGYGELNLALARLAGFAIAAVGMWRLGRHLGGFSEHEPAEAPSDLSRRGILALGLAGGLVPCWDAVALVVVSGAIGRLRLGLVLLAAFSLGMATVLVLVGLAASRLRAILGRTDRRDAWERRLGILGALILVGIGLSFLSR